MVRVGRVPGAAVHSGQLVGEADGVLDGLVGALAQEWRHGVGWGQGVESGGGLVWVERGGWVRRGRMGEG